MMDALKHAFLAGEDQLADNSQILIQATAYLNCCLSKPDLREQAAQLVSREPPSSEWPEKAAHFPQPVLCQGAHHAPADPHALYFVEQLHRAPNLLRKFVYRQVDADETDLLANAEPVLREWINEKNRLLLWLSDWCDHRGHQVLAPLAEVRSLLTYLGLDWLVKGKPHGGLLVIRVEPEGTLFKPTCLDAGLRFLWKAAPKAPTHGLTCNLDTGQHGVCEWVIPKQQGYKLTGLWHCESAAEIDLRASKLAPRFWQTCREEILQHREKNGKASS